MIMGLIFWTGVEERVIRTPDNSMQKDLKVVVLSSDSSNVLV